MITVFAGVDCSLDKVHLPDWLVAVIAAVAGSIVGILFGFLLYWCCCKRYCATIVFCFGLQPIIYGHFAGFLLLQTKF